MFFGSSGGMELTWFLIVIGFTAICTALSYFQNLQSFVRGVLVGGISLAAFVALRGIEFWYLERNAKLVATEAAVVPAYGFWIASIAAIAVLASSFVVFARIRRLKRGQ